MFFPLVMGFLIGAFLIFFTSLAILAFAPDISQMISPVLVSVLKDLGGPVAAGFGGAIAGAICSYVFQKRSEKEKETKADLSTIHKTWVRLMMQLNELYSIKKHNIYPALSHPMRFIEISKLPSKAGQVDRIDARIIDIALSVKDARAIDVLYLAEARYFACFENFMNRNEVLEEYRVTLKSAGLGRAGGHTIDELKEAVGVGLLVALHVMTEQMIEVLDQSLKTLTEAQEVVTQLVNKKYKGEGVLSLKMDMKKDEEYLMTSPATEFTVDTLKALLTRNDK